MWSPPKMLLTAQADRIWKQLHFFALPLADEQSCCASLATPPCDCWKWTATGEASALWESGYERGKHGEERVTLWDVSVRWGAVCKMRSRYTNLPQTAAPPHCGGRRRCRRGGVRYYVTQNIWHLSRIHWGTGHNHINLQSVLSCFIQMQFWGGLVTARVLCIWMDCCCAIAWLAPGLGTLSQALTLLIIYHAIKI